MEERAIRPPSDPPSDPNGNDAIEAAPGTVGPPSAVPGDPDGVEIISPAEGDWDPPPPRIMRPAQWSGWPDGWGTDWGMTSVGIEDLSDVAWTCLDLNSSVLATMPPYLIDASDSLDTGWMDNPDPDRYASWADFAKQLFWDYQLGEVFLIATARYATGYPARFHVVDPWLVDVDWRDGQRVYAVGGRDVTADVLHVRYRTRTADARGHGPLEAGRARLVAANVLARYATGFAAAGGVPPSVIEHPDELSADQATALREQWVAARLEGLGVPAVLSGGVTWKATAVNPTELALVELLQFNEARIAVLLGVPPFLVGLPSGGDSMTYSNVSSIFDYHWRAGLRPKAEAVVSAISAWALPRGTVLEVNRDEYVRPDPYTRAQTENLWIGSGVLSPEEVRGIERFGKGAPTPAPVPAPAAPAPAPLAPRGT